MEDREDLRSILPFLPLVLRSSTLFWPSQVVVALKALSKGPDHSRVDSGEVLFLAISDMRKSLSLEDERLSSSSAPDGYALFFDDLISRAEAAKWFGEVIPAMSDLLLRFPSLLEAHYQQADSIVLYENGNAVGTGLRLLESQQPGIVFLSQELIGALLACSFFCLFPAIVRSGKHLPAINFDGLFATLYNNYSEQQEQKIKCITHYFERICSSMPSAVVSFERKVLPFGCRSSVSYPELDFWGNSAFPLCSFKVFGSGLIEDQPCEALEVDFANKYLGGGALRNGCVQEEIRFMINPELIAGMLFMASMADNEAIEIVGAERYSSYSGYASSFRFSGDYVDSKGFDGLKRRKTRIVAVDALCRPGKRQFRPDGLLREVNKAFCGFFNQSKYQQSHRPLEDEEFGGAHAFQQFKGPLHDAALMTSELNKERPTKDPISYSQENRSQYAEYQSEIGIATGNWGCGAFGGDPEVKAIIQWLAASQASRPFISYYTFGLEELQILEQATGWILAHNWTVGELWNMLLDYSSSTRTTSKLGFFSWLLPSLSTTTTTTCDDDDAMVLDLPPPPPVT